MLEAVLKHPYVLQCWENSSIDVELAAEVSFTFHQLCLALQQI